MDLKAMIDGMSPQVYEALKRAVELGKWPNGERLNEEQKALCMEAVLTWDAVNLPEDRRVGFIDRGHKAEGEVCSDHDHSSQSGSESPLKWLN